MRFKTVSHNYYLLNPLQSLTLVQTKHYVRIQHHVDLNGTAISQYDSLLHGRYVLEMEHLHEVSYNIR